MSATQIGVLSTAQISQLTSTDLGGLSMEQINAISSSNATALSSPAYTKYQSLISPLVLNLTGVDALTTANIAGLDSQSFSILTSTNINSSIQTQSIEQSGVTFDLANSGNSAANVGWITPGEGFLVNLPNGATTLTNGSELFGTASVLPNGQQASNGFAALATFDSNKDGIINSTDALFTQLKVWVDTGVNANNTPVGELFTLNQLNIESINLNSRVSGAANNENVIGLVSSFTTTNGQTHEIADVWLASTDNTGSSISQLTDALNQYASNGTVGNLGKIVSDQAPSNNNGVSGSPSQNTSTSLAVENTSKASLMTSALAQYKFNTPQINSAEINSSPVLPRSDLIDPLSNTSTTSLITSNVKT